VEGRAVLVTTSEMRATWHVADVVLIRQETPNAHRIVLNIPNWPGNDAGQHVDVRLTAPDGYQATRSYSLASSGASTMIELAVDKMPDGEVSPFLVDELQPGDQIEIQGPLGRWFVWTPPLPSDPRTGPVQLIGAGSGVIPLVAMMRAHQVSGDATSFRLLYSAPSPEFVYYAAEIQEATASTAPFAVDYVFTRKSPDDSARPAGRISRADITHFVSAPQLHPRLFLCGGTAFVERVISWLIDVGHDPDNIRAERYGGS